MKEIVLNELLNEYLTTALNIYCHIEFLFYISITGIIFVFI